MSRLPPEFFKRQDERPDFLFYRQPRFVAHLDEAASRRARELYDELLPQSGHILDLMAGFESHLSARYRRVAGLGLSRAELEHNPRLDDFVLFDLNRPGPLPFDNGTFDGAICTVSVQYLTNPVRTFAEIARTLKGGAPFVVTFSNQMFPTKTVLAWRESDDRAHVRLVRSYFGEVREFGSTNERHAVPGWGDPLYGVWAHKRSLPTGLSTALLN